MLSKQGSRSSLRASLKALFPSKSQTSLCLDNGDGQEGSQDCLTDQNKATQTDSDLSYVWTNGDEVSKRKDTRASEDAVSITSRETASRNESREADLSLYSRSRDTLFIEESKDAGFNKSGCPVDTLDEGKLAKDCMSEADTISVTGTIDSRIDDLSPVKAKPCCGMLRYFIVNSDFSFSLLSPLPSPFPSLSPSVHLIVSLYISFHLPSCMLILSFIFFFLVFCILHLNVLMYVMYVCVHGCVFLPRMLWTSGNGGGHHLEPADHSLVYPASRAWLTEVAPSLCPPQQEGLGQCLECC